MKNLFLSLFAATLMFSCGDQSKNSNGSTEAPTEVEEEAVEVEEVVESAQAVCIWDRVAVRSIPSSEGKWLTSINLGEKLTYLGEEADDSVKKDRKYIKVELADGTTGWSVADFIAIEAEPAVFTSISSLYKRPDLLTKTDKEFSEMDIVAIKSTQDDWVEVVGRRSGAKWMESGWVKNGNLSQKDIDIAVAKFASAALQETDVEKQAEALKAIVENSDFQTSSFITSLSEKVDAILAPVQVETVEVETDSTAVEEDIF